MKIPLLSSASGLETVLEKVGRSLSERFGIRVVCQGNLCCTNGRTIFLPGLPDELPPEMLRIIRGYLDHETGHLLGKSNFRILKWFKEKHGADAMHFLNMLEDLRVEEVMRRRFPGSGKNLDAAYKHLIDEAVKSAEPMPVWRQLAFGVHARGNRLSAPTFVGQEVLQALDMISDRVLKAPRCRNTADVTRLAEEAWPAVSHLFPTPPDAMSAGTPAVAQGQPSGQSGQNGANGIQSGSSCRTQPSGQRSTADGSQDGTDDSAKGGNADVQAGKTDTGQAEEQAQAGGASPVRTAEDESSDNQAGAAETSDPGSDDAQNVPPLDQPSPSESSQPDDAPVPASINALNDNTQTSVAAQDGAAAPDIMRDLAGVITSMVNDYAQTTRAYRIWTTELDTVRTARNSNLIPHRQRMAALLPHVAGVRQKLLQALLAEPKARWLGDKESGNINPRALYRLAASTPESPGNARVFRERVRTKRLHTAVTLLVDQSASMAGKKMQLAENTALVFCEALSRLGIPCAVVGFSTGGECHFVVDTEAKTGMSYAELTRAYRIAPLRHVCFKRFNETIRNTSGRFVHMQALELTPLGESILFAARELAVRREERKVLFVLTDGRPEVGLDDDAATFRHAKDSIKRVERAGIDVALVGIFANCVADLHTRSVVVNSLDELPKTVMRQLHSLLTNHHSTLN